MIIDRPDDPFNYVQPGTVDTAIAPGSSQALVQALQAASKSDFAKQPDSKPLSAATPTALPAGRPMQRISLDALVQLLAAHRAQYGAMSGQPVQRSQALGLLGF